MVETIREPAREIPVFARCDVLVVGGGPAGCAAAASAARLGAKTVLVERYGHLGGMSTGGFVLWIDRMTDWQGKLVIGGFGQDLLASVPKEGIVGPAPEIWGAKTPELVDYWSDWEGSMRGVVTWSPTVDCELLKNAYIDAVVGAGTKLLLHSWGVAPLQDGRALKGVVFESKSGRQALLAKTVVDATGDGDIFAMAGAAFETDVVKGDIHEMMNVAFMWSCVDTDRFLAWRRAHRDEYNAIRARMPNLGVGGNPHPMPQKDVCVFMGPRLSGYSCIDVEDLTTVEIESRRRMMVMLDYYRKNMPGFEHARVKETAPQMGTRHSRRLVGVKRMTRKEWTSGIVHDDEVALSPPPTPEHPNVSVPLGCLVPVELDNLLAAGRNLSCDPATHTFMREVPNCWTLGQAAGVAAAVAVRSGVHVRNVNVNAVRDELRKQDVPLH